MRFLLSSLGVLSVGLLVLGVWWFVQHSVGRGLSLATPAEQAGSRLFHPEAMAATAAIYGHMILGGLLTLLAPLQLLGPVRRAVPRVHRMLGRLVAGLALATGAGGLAYILSQGTVGGPWMSLGFGLYGVLLMIAAVRTVQLARRRDPAHRAWAGRLVILALGSWIYRMHYGLWHAFTGGVATSDDFSGTFDRIQVFAFYLPYLALFEAVRLLWPSRRRSVRLAEGRAAPGRA
ncbi:DUF2306 domain-containing protein [Cereibacter azotoformans]|uniref:DUF2306 domain-containing protein n=1 Tax=Cereibacter sphaeroides (strain ATCC 17025 / ATH 2.4.3) TaxID=349102 RepID=A4WXK0_CERS5|nr:DUF2306 domain-containing protein [Cereibacter azotoformans]ULB11568.1 DUF2306 domain-containing protein [Cereibacter azotoformans]